MHTFHCVDGQGIADQISACQAVVQHMNALLVQCGRSSLSTVGQQASFYLVTIFLGKQTFEAEGSHT